MQYCCLLDLFTLISNPEQRARKFIKVQAKKNSWNQRITFMKIFENDFTRILKNFLAHCAWFNDWFRGLCDSISLLSWNSSSYFNFCSFLQFAEIFVPIYRNSNRLGCKKSISKNHKTTKFTLLKKEGLWGWFAQIHFSLINSLVYVDNNWLYFIILVQVN